MACIWKINVKIRICLFCNYRKYNEFAVICVKLEKVTSTDVIINILLHSHWQEIDSALCNNFNSLNELLNYCAIHVPQMTQKLCMFHNSIYWSITGYGSNFSFLCTMKEARVYLCGGSQMFCTLFWYILRIGFHVSIIVTVQWICHDVFLFIACPITTVILHACLLY